MDLLQLKYFMTVAGLSSYTYAAEQLHVSQPSISQSVRRLESELGVKLFDHSGRAIKLNEHGKILYNGVTQIFETLDQTLSNLELFRETSISPITIKMWERSNLCVRLLSAFIKEYPYIKIRLIECGDEEAADVTLAVSNSSHQKNSRVILQEKICLMMSVNHPLANRDSIRLADAKDCDFIMLGKGAPFRSVVTEYCHQAGFEPRVTLEADYSGTIIRMLQLGEYVSLMTPRMAQPYLDDWLKILDISSPVCIRTINIIYKDMNVESYPSVKIFTQFAADYLSKQMH